MPGFNIPCWPGTSKSHFNEDDPPPPTAVREVNPMQDDADLQKPTHGEYAGEAAKEFLKVLEEVARNIPVPGLGTAVQLATNLIQACEESHATLERAQELKRRIKTLVILLVDELKEKKAEEIQEKLRKDVKDLERDLGYIQNKLNEIASQHAILVVFFRGINEDKIRRCVSRLDNSLERFNLAREIDNTKTLDRHTDILNQLEKSIITFHSNQQRMLQGIQTGMTEVLAILHQPHPTQSQSRARIPANTGNFHGRDGVVAELVHILTDEQKHLHACLLGPGGMGKTSTALAVMAHPDLKRCFPAGRQVWVPCVKATSVSLFFDTLYSSLGIARNTGNTRSDILAELHASEEALILLLDNFETPWNVDGGRSEAEQILRDLDQIKHITLFLTMRSSSGPPCDDIRWHSVDLRAVDADAARQIYTDIYPKGRKDRNLETLLDLVGHMPLAVTLMAKVAKTMKLPTEKLINEYNRVGTAMLSHGSDAEHSIEVSIRLSIDSSPMKKHPDALELLATLTMLPVGTTFDMPTSCWARASQNLVSAIAVLSDASLVEQRDDTFFVLPVIRHYVLHPSRFPDKVRTAMIETACDFLAKHRSLPGDVSYKAHTAAMLVEEGNLEGILLEATVPTPELIEGLLTLAHHQESTRPRTDVIEHALKLANAMEGNGLALGQVQFCYGDILSSLGRYDSAIKHYIFARETFLLAIEKARAAECSLKLAETYSFTGDKPLTERKALICGAKIEFESIDDTRGIALCLYHLGFAHWQCNMFSDALDFFMRAKTMLTGLQEDLYLAHTSKMIGRLYFYTAKHQDAEEFLTSAIEAYERIGCYNTDAQRTLSRVLVLKGDYHDAIRLLVQSLEQSKSRGSPYDIARTLIDMGRCWTKMGGKVADAQGAFEESRRYFSSLHTQTADSFAVMCNFFLRRLEDPSVVPSNTEKTEWWSCYCEDDNEMSMHVVSGRRENSTT